MTCISEIHSDFEPIKITTASVNLKLQNKQNYSIIQGPTCEEVCKEGSFGSECSQKCDCLNNNKCDPVTGECNCNGWMGKKCETSCPRGKYGPMCSLKCTLCGGLEWENSNAACNATTGECICETGYTGAECKDRSEDCLL